ncbi:ADP-ribosylation factor-like protein 8A [Platysternon megacephalum]|uniref:ADP-ribosylation factor-like protein 8A n=1 Tax=Platysternon megacephalum TaxID=55544 RepID=A0A4D9DX31_9SAUR|nr:ADP-ribosylation factor-like protein 8A [Platysternon megacephalum]
MHISESQQEFFRMLDEKIEKERMKRNHRNGYSYNYDDENHITQNTRGATKQSSYGNDSVDLISKTVGMRSNRQHKAASLTTAANAWVGGCIGGCNSEGKEVLGGEFGGKLIAASCSLWNSRLQQTANGCGGIVNKIHSYFTNFIVRPLRSLLWLLLVLLAGSSLQLAAKPDVWFVKPPCKTEQTVENSELRIIRKMPSMQNQTSATNSTWLCISGCSLAVKAITLS